MHVFLPLHILWLAVVEHAGALKPNLASLSRHDAKADSAFPRGHKEAAATRGYSAREPGIRRLLVLKRERSGSTWLDDLLAHHMPQFQWYVSEFQHSEMGSVRCRLSHIDWLREYLTDPCGDAYKERDMQYFRPEPECRPAAIGGHANGCRGRALDHGPAIVGVSLNPLNAIQRRQKDGWQLGTIREMACGSGRFSELPGGRGVAIVHMIRSNMVKHALSWVRSEGLFRACKTRKILTKEEQECAQAYHATNITLAEKQISSLVQTAAHYAAYTAAEAAVLQAWAGEPDCRSRGVLNMTYEAMQQDTPREMSRLLAYLGLTGPAAQVPHRLASDSVKLPGTEDLRRIINNFDEVEAAMRPYPWMHEQLMSRRKRIFPLPSHFAPQSIEEALMIVRSGGGRIGAPTLPFSFVSRTAQAPGMPFSFVARGPAVATKRH